MKIQNVYLKRIMNSRIQIAEYIASSFSGKHTLDACLFEFIDTAGAGLKEKFVQNVFLVDKRSQIGKTNMPKGERISLANKTN